MTKNDQFEYFKMCPICRNSIGFSANRYPLDSDAKWHVGCSNCGKSTKYYKNRKEVSFKWNSWAIRYIKKIRDHYKDQLHTCPVCGSLPLVFRRDKGYFVGCISCHYWDFNEGHYGVYYKSIKLAIDGWNRKVKRDFKGFIK